MKTLWLTIFAVLAFSLTGCNKACVERLNRDCVCTKEYNPVCGCNGKTYSNACMAECSGITKYTQGECE